VKRMKAEGHQVASHTYTHPDLDTLSSTERENQMVNHSDFLPRLDAHGGFVVRILIVGVA